MVTPAAGPLSPRQPSRDAGFVSLGCSCTCEHCRTCYFRSLALLNLHSTGLRSLHSRGEKCNKGNSNEADCQCACSGPLHIPSDPLEKEKLLRNHSFYFSCISKSAAREGGPTHVRGMSLAELEAKLLPPRPAQSSRQALVTTGTNDLTSGQDASSAGQDRRVRANVLFRAAELLEQSCVLANTLCATCKTRLLISKSTKRLRCVICEGIAAPGYIDDYPWGTLPGGPREEDGSVEMNPTGFSRALAGIMRQDSPTTMQGQPQPHAQPRNSAGQFVAAAAAPVQAAGRAANGGAAAAGGAPAAPSLQRVKRPFYPRRKRRQISPAAPGGVVFPADSQPSVADPRWASSHGETLGTLQDVRGGWGGDARGGHPGAGGGDNGVGGAVPLGGGGGGNGVGPPAGRDADADCSAAAPHAPHMGVSGGGTTQDAGEDIPPPASPDIDICNDTVDLLVYPTSSENGLSGRPTSGGVVSPAGTCLSPVTAPMSGGVVSPAATCVFPTAGPAPGCVVSLAVTCVSPTTADPDPSVLAAPLPLQACSSGGGRLTALLAGESEDGERLCLFEETHAGLGPGVMPRDSDGTLIDDSHAAPGIAINGHLGAGVGPPGTAEHAHGWPPLPGHADAALAATPLDPGLALPPAGIPGGHVHWGVGPDVAPGNFRREGDPPAGEAHWAADSRGAGSAVALGTPLLAPPRVPTLGVVAGTFPLDETAAGGDARGVSGPELALGLMPFPPAEPSPADAHRVWGAELAPGNMPCPPSGETGGIFSVAAAAAFMGVGALPVQGHVTHVGHVPVQGHVAHVGHVPVPPATAGMAREITGAHVGGGASTWGTGRASAPAANEGAEKLVYYRLPPRGQAEGGETEVAQQKPPRKPRTPFQIFSGHYRRKKPGRPGRVDSASDPTAKAWQELTPLQRQNFEDLSKRERDAYELAYKEWRKGVVNPLELPPAIPPPITNQPCAMVTPAGDISVSAAVAPHPAPAPAAALPAGALDPDEIARCYQTLASQAPPGMPLWQWLAHLGRLASGGNASAAAADPPAQQGAVPVGGPAPGASTGASRPPQYATLYGISQRCAAQLEALDSVIEGGKNLPISRHGGTPAGPTPAGKGEGAPPASPTLWSMLLGQAKAIGLRSEADPPTAAPLPAPPPSGPGDPRAEHGALALPATSARDPRAVPQHGATCATPEGGDGDLPPGPQVANGRHPGDPGAGPPPANIPGAGPGGRAASQGGGGGGSAEPAAAGRWTAEVESGAALDALASVGARLAGSAGDGALTHEGGGDDGSGDVTMRDAEESDAEDRDSPYQTALELVGLSTYGKRKRQVEGPQNGISAAGLPSLPGGRQREGGSAPPAKLQAGGNNSQGAKSPGPHKKSRTAEEWAPRGNMSWALTLKQRCAAVAADLLPDAEVEPLFLGLPPGQPCGPGVNSLQAQLGAGGGFLAPGHPRTGIDSQPAHPTAGEGFLPQPAKTGKPGSAGPAHVPSSGGAEGVGASVREATIATIKDKIAQLRHKMEITPLDNVAEFQRLVSLIDSLGSALNTYEGKGSG